MNTSTLRRVILVTGLLTAAVHLIVLNVIILSTEGHFDLLFSLNGLGYLTLLGFFFFAGDFVEEQWDFFHFAFMGFA